MSELSTLTPPRLDVIQNPTSQANGMALRAFLVTLLTGVQALEGAGGTQVDLIFDAATELTIASGGVTTTQGFHSIDTEGDAASDDLDTINGMATGEICIVVAANPARTVVLKHGTGNLYCQRGQDVSLAEDSDAAILFKVSSTKIAVFAVTLAGRTTSSNTASITMSGSTAGTVATNDAVPMVGTANYFNPVAAEATAGAATLVADVVVTDVALTIAAQPTVPVRLNIMITDGDSSISAGTLAIVGLDAAGQSITENVVLTGGTATKTTSKAFGHITSATVSGLAGNTGADKVAIGMSAQFGVPLPTGFSAFAAAYIYCNGVKEAIAAQDATYGIVGPTTAPNGTHDYYLVYKYAMTPTQASHVHASTGLSATDAGHTHTS